MPRVVHFEIPADDLSRAVKFYADVFGWQLRKWDGPDEYWLAITGDDSQPGINGGLMKRADFPNFIAPINTIEVPSVDDFSRAVVEHGGQIVVPKTTVSGLGYLTYCQDTEGNTFGILQVDRNAH
ncbi:MAG: VOC family protein [Acidobacteria bacterium]|nr:VOC family protein [Acidobacteriota bacterium]